MALKFLNKKGWHTGSLRNIETVWKAEQKHEAEQKKLEELKKQINDEREASEFRLLQEQAGLAPRQERLEFLYDAGLQVGKTSSTDEYLLGKPVEVAAEENQISKVASAPGSLFVEEKPVSANDTWRKLHSDPLLLIRQQEQAALARIKNNPVKMEQLRKEVEMKKKAKEDKKRKKEAKQQHKDKNRKKRHRSSSEESSEPDQSRARSGSANYHDIGTRKREIYTHSNKQDNYGDTPNGRSPDPRDRRHNINRSDNAHDIHGNSDRKGRHGHPADAYDDGYQRHRDDRIEGVDRKRSRHYYPEDAYAIGDRKHRDGHIEDAGDLRSNDGGSQRERHGHSVNAHHSESLDREKNQRSGSFRDSREPKLQAKDHLHSSMGGCSKDIAGSRENDHSGVMVGKRLSEQNQEIGTGEAVLHAQLPPRPTPRAKHKAAPMSDAERAARLLEMQDNADLHEEQRWHRLKHAADADIAELKKTSEIKPNQDFMLDTQRNMYGTDKNGTSTLEKGVKRRAHFHERSGAEERNAFRR
ncbi:hypothetical protein CY35_19G023400 [Sphagnum magellanicum]|nr:hypothetical protein CY35_19G023400 [Sphagnum magellanicum]